MTTISMQPDSFSSSSRSLAFGDARFDKLRMLRLPLPWIGWLVSLFLMRLLVGEIANWFGLPAPSTPDTAQLEGACT